MKNKFTVVATLLIILGAISMALLSNVTLPTELIKGLFVLGLIVSLQQIKKPSKQKQG